MVTLTWHIIYNPLPLEDKTLRLCVKCKVKCAKPVVTIALNSLPTIPWWLLCDRLPWLPDIEGTSPSICAVAIASTLPRSNLPSRPLPPLPPLHHPHSPLAIQTPLTQRREEKVDTEAFWTLWLQKNWTEPTKAGERERRATGAIKNSLPMESPTACEPCTVNSFSLCCLALPLCVTVIFFLLMFSAGFQAVFYCENCC